MISRRRFLQNACVAGAALPAWAKSAHANDMKGISALSGSQFDLSVAESRPYIDGRRARAITVNGQLPAPLLRWREGDHLTLRVTNHLDTDTSIHWHGILLPYEMDGVPGLTFPGIKPGETFTYHFPLKQAGTYWYHSHSGLQEQQGHYGPIIIEPKGADPVGYDREYVVVLSDWTFQRPERILAKLKKHSEAMNFQRRTLGDFFSDVGEQGFDAAMSDRLMWGGMRMDPADIADLGGETYTYLVNGHGPGDNWTGLFTPGERVRLRIINASAMTIFNVRIPGLPMTVVQADGLNVEPVTVDEFQMGVAETYDVIVTPPEDGAYTLMCESIDRSGYARATLATAEGMSAPVPDLRPRPTLTHKDMAMAHGDMDHGSMDHGGMKKGETDHGTMDHGEMDHGSMEHGTMDHGKMDHGKMDHGAAPPGPQRHDHPKGPGVVGLAEAPTNRLGEPGIGLEHVGHRVLTYMDLRSLEPNPDMRAPEREMEIHLTSNMHRYMWSFDGVKFSDIKGPIVFHEGERLRVTLVNDTMMSHPIHLHGMFFDLVTGDHHHKPRKHTVIVKPGDKFSFDVTPDAVGEWAFHCHLLYHMIAGMMQVVSVRPRKGGMTHHPKGHGKDESHGDHGGHKPKKGGHGSRGGHGEHE